MAQLLLSALLLFAMSAGSPNPQSSAGTTAGASVLATVQISTPVLAGGTWLAGRYEVRLAGEHPTPRVGQPRTAQESMEFVVNGKVVARDVAEILYDDDLPSIGASSQRAKTGTRVELLKGGEFLRISVKRERERYLIYLPLQK
jgi:hypothetical protein